jgi:hypothetical protein
MCNSKTSDRCRQSLKWRKFIFHEKELYQFASSLSSILVRIFAWGVVYGWFDLLSCQIKDYKNGIWCFFL